MHVLASHNLLDYSSIILNLYLWLKRVSSDENDNTAIHVAAENGSISNVKLLVFNEKELVDVVNKEDQTALHLASKNGHVGIVSFLLENGADPLKRNKWGRTVLECAINNKQRRVVDELLRSDNWKKVSLWLWPSTNERSGWMAGR